ATVSLSRDRSDSPARRDSPARGDDLLTELSQSLSPRFSVLARLGRGGMGVVFLGFVTLLQRRVAFQLLPAELRRDESARTRFLREAQAAAAVEHPNVVNVYQVGELLQSDTPYFVMRFIDGELLESRFPAETRATESMVRSVIGDVAAALSAA